MHNNTNINDNQKDSRIQDAKAVEEKAARIKDWVMKKLKEVCFCVYMHRMC